MGATVGYHYFRGEYVEPFDICEQALKEAYDAGYLGENILGSGITINIYNVKSAGAYICGEETGLMNALKESGPGLATSLLFLRMLAFMVNQPISITPRLWPLCRYFV